MRRPFEHPHKQAERLRQAEEEDRSNDLLSWRRVEDGLPPIDPQSGVWSIRVLVYGRETPKQHAVVIDIYYYPPDGKTGFWRDHSTGDVTHWMPLPEPPR